MKEINLNGLNETIYYEKLNSGLKVYMWQKRTLNSFYATLSVKYGSIYNEFMINKKTYKLPRGVAHFLEHVKFNEDKDTTAHDYFHKLGSDTNAFTTFNYTNYQVLGSNNVKECVLHLLDFVENDYFTKKIIDNEKGIITEEAKMGEDDPYTVMLFKHLNNIFNSYEHRKLITGNKEDIKSITLDDIKNAYYSFYHPENMFLVITGNFNPYEVIESIKENESKKDFGKYILPKRIIKKENKKVNIKYEEESINISNTKIRIGIKIPISDFKNTDKLHIRLYLNLLLRANFGNTSDFKDMLLSKELINNMGYMMDIFDDYIIIMFTIDSEYKSEIIKLFNEKLDNLTIDEKTFIRMKNANIASLILEFEDVELVNSAIQGEILNYGDIIDNIKPIYENINYKDIVSFNKSLNLKERSIIVFNSK